MTGLLLLHSTLGTTAVTVNGLQRESLGERLPQNASTRTGHGPPQNLRTEPAQLSFSVDAVFWIS